MNTLNSSKLLYFFLCCINATLLLLILLSGTHPPSVSGDSFAPYSHDSMANRPMRKMAMASSLVKKLPHPNRRVRPPATLHRNAYMAVQFHLSDFISARRSLLHLSDGHQDVITAKLAPINANHAAAGASTSTNIPNNDDFFHEVDASATFHLDYSGPKTHPPKNN